MTAYNERKYQFINYIKDNPESTSEEVADEFDLEIHNVRTLLRTYNRQGKLSRHKITDWGTRAYEITEKGLRWLKWFEGQEISGDFNDEEENKEVVAPKPAEVARPPVSPVDRLEKFIELLERLDK